MKIALINENSQVAKNALIEATLRKVVEPMGHEVVNYGMYAADDAAQLTYVQNGILAAVLLNAGAADYVITGCGTGEGAMLALNSFPGVICGHVEDLCSCERWQCCCPAVCQRLWLGRRAEPGICV